MTLSDAERQIAAILAALERSSESLVRSVDIVDVEVTTCSDDRRQHLRRVRIDLERLPGTRWSK